MSRAAAPALIQVVAVAENGVIGRDGTMPWRLKSDMAHFRELTMGKPVVMGRKTFQSLPKPLELGDFYVENAFGFFEIIHLT